MGTCHAWRVEMVMGYVAPELLNLNADAKPNLRVIFFRSVLCCMKSQLEGNSRMHFKRRKRFNSEERSLALEFNNHVSA